MNKKKLLLVFNPLAGQEIIRMNLFEVIELLSANGFLVTAHPTQGKRDAFQVIKTFGATYDYVVCSGGDGTLNEAVDAMMTLPKRPVFGYIPSGTTNDFATSIGLPSDVLLATQVIYTGKQALIDIGKFQQEHFSYVAAFGLFTDVSYGTSQNLKNLFGHAAYVLEGMKRLGTIRSWRCRVVADGEEFVDDFIFGMITNSASIGGFNLPGPNTSGDDREFKLILLKKVNTLLNLQSVIATLLGREEENDHFIIRKAHKVTIHTKEPLDWTLDGEYGGSFTETNLEIIHDALSIMIPKND